MHGEMRGHLNDGLSLLVEVVLVIAYDICYVYRPTLQIVFLKCTATLPLSVYLLFDEKYLMLI